MASKKTQSQKTQSEKQSQSNISAAKSAAKPAAKPAKKQRKLISVYSILLLLAVVVAILSWVFSAVDHSIFPASFSDIIMAPEFGFEGAIQIIIYLFIMGGFLALVEKTGALRAGIGVLVKKLNGKELLLIPVLMIIFSILGSAYGFCEETLGFIGIIAATMLAAGFDPLVAVGVVSLGAGVGCMCATVNPFGVGVAASTLNDTFAQMGMTVDVSQIQVIGIGLLLLVVCDAIAITFVYRYAKKVKLEKGSILSPQEMDAAKKDFGKFARFEASAEAAGEDGLADGVIPIAAMQNAEEGLPAETAEEKKDLKNIAAEVENEKVTKAQAAKVMTMTAQQKVVLALFVIAFLGMIVAFVPWAELNVTIFAGWSKFLTGSAIGEWGFLDASAWFFFMSLIVMFVSGKSEKENVDTFVAGAADMTGVIIIIALARAISVLMSSTGIADWVLNAASEGLAGVNAFVFAPLSWLVMDALAFFVPSSSGLATMSMPIMGPLAHNLGFSASVMIQIYSTASGFMNLFVPTAVAIMGGLAIVHVEYSTFIKWIFKLLVILAIVVVVILSACLFLIPA